MRQSFRIRVLLCVLAYACAQAGVAQNVKTWWPDPATGLMWTGNPVAEEVTFATAQAACVNLRLGGYTDWRLPTEAETNATITSYKSQAYQYDDFASGPPYKTSPVPNTYDTVVALKFRPDKLENMWTSTPTAPGEYETWAFHISTGTTSSSTKATATSSLKNGDLAAMCVRRMEPAVVDLAKVAQPPYAISDVNALTSMADTVHGMQAVAAGDYPTAIRFAQSALALLPSYAWPWTVIIKAEALSRDWAAAQTAMKTAKKQTQWSDESTTKWVKRLQKTVTADPATLHFWQRYEQGNEALRTGQNEEALAIADELQKLQPTWPEPLLIRAQALDGLKRWDDSVKTYEQAEKLDKHHETEAELMRSQEQDTLTANR